MISSDQLGKHRQETTYNQFYLGRLPLQQPVVNRERLTAMNQQQITNNQQPTTNN